LLQGWSLTYLGYNPTPEGRGQDEIFLLLPNTIDQNNAELEESFDNLKPGQYDLQFGDNGLDGICCSFGNGKLYLVNDLTGETVWEHDGQYKGYLQVIIQIDGAQGSISVIYESETFQPSWQQLELPNNPPTFDPQWPGPMPDAPLFSFNVNFKFDAYPFESVYRMFYTPGTLDQLETIDTMSWSMWAQLDNMDGVTDGLHNRLLSRAYSERDAGWYWLLVSDFGSDGICCTFRRGWATILAPLNTTMETGLAWDTNGQYGAGLSVFFYMNDAGFVEKVVSMESQDEVLPNIQLEQGRNGDALDFDRNIGKKPPRRHHMRQR
jgi:hypothetical protein